MPENLGAHVLHTALKEFRQIKTLGDKAMAQLDEPELFTAIEPESNSIAVIVKSRVCRVARVTGRRPQVASRKPLGLA